MGETQTKQEMSIQKNRLDHICGHDVPEMICLLLSESVLLLFTPHVHNLPVLVHLHGVVHQSVHVDELDALLLRVEQHGRDDCQLSHLLLCVLLCTDINTETNILG